MLQAEVGSAKITEEHSYPRRGHLMRDFTLPSSDGRPVSLYDYRGRSNLVLIFGGNVSQRTEKEFLSELVQRYAAIREQDAEALLILACSRERAERIKYQTTLPFPVLADDDMQIHKSVGALGAQAVPVSALYVTDRFLEVFAAWRTGERDSLPSVSEVLSWLGYIDSRCPECTQAEWPTDD